MFVPAVRFSTVDRSPRLSCQWCSYMERFTVVRYLLTVAVHSEAETENTLISLLVPGTIILTVSPYIYSVVLVAAVCCLGGPRHVISNTHRWRWRDSTVELSCVDVALTSAVCIEFATSSRRLSTKIWKLNMLEFILSSWVVSAVCTRPSAVVTQFTILQPICDWRRKLGTGSRLTTGAFTQPTRRNSTSLSANCSDSSRLIETVAN